MLCVQTGDGTCVCSHIVYSLTQPLTKFVMQRATKRQGEPFSHTKRKTHMVHFSLLLYPLRGQMSHFGEGMLQFVSTNY